MDKWIEKHFQICKIILNGDAINSNGNINSLEMDVAVSKANRMIELLRWNEIKLSKILDKTGQK